MKRFLATDEGVAKSMTFDIDYGPNQVAGPNQVKAQPSVEELRAAMFDAFDQEGAYLTGQEANKPSNSELVMSRLRPVDLAMEAARMMAQLAGHERKEGEGYGVVSRYASMPADVKADHGAASSYRDAIL